jgi:hypothetical protein
MTTRAPASWANAAAASPTGPLPWTTTFSPSRTGRRSHRAWIMVGPAQARAIAATWSVSGGSLMTVVPCSRVMKSAQEPDSG